MTFAETLTISYSEEESSRTNRSETTPKKNIPHVPTTTAWQAP